jgi:uncharacterized protein (DUF736 family)
MDEQKFSGPPHPMAGKVVLSGYASLGHRLGVPRSSAVRLVESGKIKVFSEGNHSMVADEKDIERVALQAAVEAEAAWERAQDRALVARTLADPDKATDNELVYSLARVTGREHSELFWHFSKRREAGRPLIAQKLEKEQAAIEDARATFPRRVNRYNLRDKRTEEVLMPPLPRSRCPEE